MWIRFVAVSKAALCTLPVLLVTFGCSGKVQSMEQEPLAVAGRGAAELEVLHWMGPATDSSPLAILRNAFVSGGGHWRDVAMPSVSVAQATAVNRILGGNPPEVFQYSIGARLNELATHGLVAAVPVVCADWDKIILPIIARSAKRGDHYVAAPVGIYGENWMFYNVAVLRQAGLAVPKSWPELLSDARKLQAAGKIPIAVGGQPWQERILFNSVLLGIGGRKFYRRVYEDLDATAISSRLMLEVFRTVGELRGLVDEGSPGRPWDQTALLVLHGTAAFQLMGDWVKEPIRAAGLKLGTQIGCALAPASEESYIMAVDAFAFSNTLTQSARDAQRLFAETVLSADVQVKFNQAKGAIPVRVDVPGTGFDECAQHAMEVVRNPDAQLMSIGLFGLPGGISGAIEDSIAEFWHDRQLTPEQGQALFVRNVFAFR
jgi:glucose/mannose transport system substrate-binding protein